MPHWGFWQELKRRHVYRVAAAYAFVGWLLIQVATQVFPVFHLPDWIDQTVVLLILIGFPIALVLAWAFDATPHGIVRTDTEGGADSRAPQHSHRAGIAVGLIGVLVAVAAGAGWWHAERSGFGAPVTQDKASAPSVAKPSLAPTAAGVSAAKRRVSPAPPIAAQPIPAKSIAVLPFENLSEDKGNACFADGMQDLILTKLTVIGNPKMISRTSTASRWRTEPRPRPRHVSDAVGERDRALKLLDDGSANGTAIPQLPWVPVFDPVHNDPRFKAALKKMRLPYTQRDVPTQ